MSNKSMQKNARKPWKRGPDTAVLKDIRESLLTAQLSGEPDVKDVILSRPLRNRISHFEFSQLGTITSSAAVETDGAISFALNNLTGYTSITTLFDQYRITGVNIKFIPSQLVYTAAAQPMFTVLDYDDATPVVVSSLAQYDTLKIAPASAYFERSLKPRTAVAAYAGAFTSFGNVSNMWMDSASPGVLYYGVKYGILASANAPSWSYIARIMVEARAQR
jgi:hypothetical protein